MLGAALTSIGTAIYPYCGNYGGFYIAQQIREVIEYAEQRSITVILQRSTSRDTAAPRSNHCLICW
ncbi:hypothetical protein OH492_04505 [Vibrio chagasii]|nr:hypothetical protein [Vibrio chagasii]